MGLKLGSGYWSLGLAVVAALALLLGRVVGSLVKPAQPGATCDPAPPFVVSLPETLAAATLQPGPAAAGARATATPARGQRTATPAFVTTSVAASPTPAVAGVPLRGLLRGDDPPSSHDVAITAGSAMPLVLPPPCQVPGPERRRDPCVGLLPPGGSLCVSGVVGIGRLDPEQPPAFAFQAGRVTVRDAQGGVVFEQLQGFFRIDDPRRGLVLICPAVQSLGSVGPNARQVVALCSNRGEQGWAVSGQVTDGGQAAADSVSLQVYGPDGSGLPIVGSVSRGAIIVREAPDEREAR